MGHGVHLGAGDVAEAAVNGPDVEPFGDDFCLVGRVLVVGIEVSAAIAAVDAPLADVAVGVHLIEALGLQQQVSCKREEKQCRTT